MYCGKNKTALASQQQISDALLELMRAKPFSAISVSELCKRSRVSRQTFYSLFRSKENVVLFTLQEKYCCQPAAPAGPPTLGQLCAGYSDYIFDNRAFLKLLVDNDIIYLLYDSIYSSFMDCHCPMAVTGPAERGYAAHFLAGGLTGIVKNFCLEDCRLSRSDLRGLLNHLFSGSVFV